jgi:hypothetical protein
VSTIEAAKKDVLVPSFKCKGVDTSERTHFASAVQLALSRTADGSEAEPKKLISGGSESLVLFSVSEDMAESLSDSSTGATCHIRLITLAFDHIHGSDPPSSFSKSLTAEIYVSNIEWTQ